MTKLRDLIHSTPKTIDVDATVDSAIHTLLWHNLRYLPVLDAGKLVGVVSSRDLAWYSARTGNGATEHPLSEAMQVSPKTASPNESLAEAAVHMATAQLDYLAVTENGRLLSLLTTMDVLAAQAREVLERNAARGPVVADFMTKAPDSVHGDCSLLDAAARMQTKNFRHLPVANGAGKLVGMISDRDLRSALGYLMQAVERTNPGAEAERIRVRQVMTHEVVSTTPEASLHDAAMLIAGASLSALPVVDDQDRLVGIISTVDLLRGLVSSS